LGDQGTAHAEPLGLAELEQLHVELNSESSTVDTFTLQLLKLTLHSQACGQATCSHVAMMLICRAGTILYFAILIYCTQSIAIYCHIAIQHIVS